MERINLKFAKIIQCILLVMALPTLAFPSFPAGEKPLEEGDEFPYVCDPSALEITRIHRIYGEYRLNEVLNDPSLKSNTKFYFMPNEDGEFVITGDFLNTSALWSWEKNTAVFDGFNHCVFTFEPGTPTKIVFRPNHTTSYNTSTGGTGVTNKRMFVFRNCENIHIRDMEIYLDWKPGASQPNVLKGVHYYANMINFTEGNVNVLMNDVKISGVMNYTYDTGIIEDLAYVGAVSVGQEPDATFGDLHKVGYTNLTNQNICFVGNEIFGFRIQGITATNCTNIDIMNNTVEFIWENDEDFASQSAGVHLAHVNTANVTGNYIHSIFSLWTDLNTYSQFGSGALKYEEYQHGIYVAKASKNIVLDNNEIRYISGAGLHINGKSEDKVDNITISNNLVFYAMNFGLVLRYVGGNISIVNNRFYHCAYKLTLPFYQDLPNCQMCGKSDKGVIDIYESHNGDIDASNFIMHSNIVKNGFIPFYTTTYNGGAVMSSANNNYKFYLVHINVGSALHTRIKNTSAVYANLICLENYHTPMGLSFGQNPVLFKVFTHRKYDDMVTNGFGTAFTKSVSSGTNPCTGPN